MNTKRLVITLTILSLLFSSINSDISETLIKLIPQSNTPRKIAVAGGDNESMLECCRRAKNVNIATCILIGNKDLIESMAKQYKIIINDFEIINIDNEIDAARYAVKLVHDGDADMFAKGSIETKICLEAILDKEIGLKDSKTLSSVTVIDATISIKKRLLILSDAIFKPLPSLSEKIQMVNNCVEIAESLGIKKPKVAIITAGDNVNYKFTETIEADLIKQANNKGDIKNCIVEGPISLDLALDIEAAELKKVKNKRIMGNADILIFPDITSANVAYKMFSRLLKWQVGNIVTGTSKPCIIPSRTDSTEDKYITLLLATVYSIYKYN